MFNAARLLLVFAALATASQLALACPDGQYEMCILGQCVCMPAVGGPAKRVDGPDRGIVTPALPRRAVTPSGPVGVELWKDIAVGPLSPWSGPRQWPERALLSNSSAKGRISAT